jgi:DNA-directed RNA polymerase subunit RPC12/RpoP
MNPTIMTLRLPVARTVFGHSLRQIKISSAVSTLCGRCGEAILDQGTTASHVSHNLSCFFRGHHYVHIATRAAHDEYVCDKCGHPLLLELVRVPHENRTNFTKRVNYGCGLRGHRVHVVANGLRGTEYACLCGHSFVKTTSAMTIIRHPLACIVQGHLLKINEVRGEWAEYVCCRCGHPFCFKVDGVGALNSDLEQRSHG